MKYVPWPSFILAKSETFFRNTVVFTALSMLVPAAARTAERFFSTVSAAAPSASVNYRLDDAGYALAGSLGSIFDTFGDMAALVAHAREADAWVGKLEPLFKEISQGD